MAWSAHQILAWLDEVEPRAEDRSHFEWLEMMPSASSLAIQNAYHAIARTRHPDLARKLLGARDHDRLVRMYSRITGAYAALRTPEAAARYLRERRDSQKLATTAASDATMMPRTTTSPPMAPISQALPTVPLPTAGLPGSNPPAPTPAKGPIDPSRAMNARALACYRRAEGALRTGDRSTAILQIKMAIAADPRSPLLRAALAELTQK